MSAADGAIALIVLSAIGSIAALFRPSALLILLPTALFAVVALEVGNDVLALAVAGSGFVFLGLVRGWQFAAERREENGGG